MSKKWYITPKIRHNYNAGSKAVRDVNNILERNNYLPINFGYDGSYFFVKKIIIILFQLCSILLTIRKNDIVFIQYPLYLNKGIRKIFYKLISNKNVQLITLIHDLPSIRYYSKENEDIILQKSDIVICHTPAMKEYLMSIGITGSKIKILYLFDYLTNSQNNNNRLFTNTITFAGNLEKSKFIPLLPEIQDVNFLLYGVPEVQFDSDSNVQYMGKFHPDNISDIKGDWGLVWDGNSINTCDGSLGEYLKYNSSHKISLYIAAGMPVIIWEKSSLRDFIVDNHLGISVNSLFEIKNRILSLTSEEKDMILNSIHQYSITLREGGMLNKIIDKDISL